MEAMSRNIRFRDKSSSVCGLSRTKVYQIEQIPSQHMLGDHHIALSKELALNCPYIIKYYKVKHLPEQQQVYTVLEKVKGTTMDQLMRHGCPSYEVVKEMIFKILKGFEAVHSTGILHRDVCMDNVFIEFTFPFFTPKICGFNLYEPIHTNNSMLLTNSAYLAPEVKKYSDYDIRSEIWAIGVLVYNILCAKFQPGFDTGLNKIFSSHSQNIDLDITPHCFKEFLQVALDKNPNNRPDTLTELNQILHQCLDARGKVMYNVVG